MALTTGDPDAEVQQTHNGESNDVQKCFFVFKIIEHEVAYLSGVRAVYLVPLTLPVFNSYVAPRTVSIVDAPCAVMQLFTGDVRDSATVSSM
jgi:hypothetical protein